MRRSIVAILMSLSLMAGSGIVAPSTATAATTCGSKNANLVYQDVIFEPGKAYATVTLHASGCWNGTKSWGTRLRVTVVSNRIFLGSQSRTQDPTFENMSSGNTYFASRPVYKGSGGTIFLYYPGLLLSAKGVWTPYDNLATACSDPDFNPYADPTTSMGANSIQIGAIDLSSSGIGGFSCPYKLTAFNPVLKSKSLTSYTP